MKFSNLILTGIIALGFSNTALATFQSPPLPTNLQCFAGAYDSSFVSSSYSVVNNQVTFPDWTVWYMADRNTPTKVNAVWSTDNQETLVTNFRQIHRMLVNCEGRARRMVQRLCASHPSGTRVQATGAIVYGILGLFYFYPTGEQASTTFYSTCN